MELTEITKELGRQGELKRARRLSRKRRVEIVNLWRELG